MKKYKVKVNGKVYEVELEAVEESKGSIEASAPVKEVVSGNKNILAPIGGKVLDFKVKIGDIVNKGDTVCIIEAMKLENEVKSAFSGKVVDIKVTKGAIVANKDLLIELN